MFERKERGKNSCPRVIATIIRDDYKQSHELMLSMQIDYLKLIYVINVILDPTVY